PGVSGRPLELRAPARRADGRAVARAHARAARVGDRRRGLVAAEEVVRREALLRLARVEGLQDARPRAALEVPLVRRVPRVRGRAAQARAAALAARHARRRARRARARAALPRARADLERLSVR